MNRVSLVEFTLQPLLRAVWQLWVMLLLLSACGGGDSDSGSKPAKPAGTVSLMAVNASTSNDGKESDLTPVTFNVTLSRVNDTGAAIAVDYYFSGGTAQGGGIDYDSSQSQVFIAVGSRTGVISVPVTQDLLAENRETVEVTLEKISHADFSLADNAKTRTASIIDDDAPHIIAVDIKGVGGYYYTGDVLTFYVQYEDEVQVTGTPRLGFKLGNNTNNGPLTYADYTTGTDTDTLSFEYTVLAGDQDADGIEIPLETLDGYNHATITSISGTVNALTDLPIEAVDLWGFDGKDPDGDGVLNQYADYDGDGVRGDAGDGDDYWAATSRINHHPNMNVAYTEVPSSTLPDKTYLSPFKVMTWEAKNDGSDGVISQSDSNPWTDISWNSAKAECTAAGKHLIRENQWLVIAHNVVQQDVNWTGGAKGHGMLKRGHSDDDPDPNLSLGYLPGANNAWAGSKNDRVLQLSNGEVIWDLAGNVWEWVYMDEGLPGTDDVGEAGLGRVGNYVGYPDGVAPVQADYFNLEHDSVINSNIKPDSSLVENSAVDGVGRIRIKDNMARPFVRGGKRDVSLIAGVLAMDTIDDVGTSGEVIGFRCTD